MVAYILQQIKDTSLDFSNEIIIDYIKEQIKDTMSNSKLDIKEKSLKIISF